IWIPPYCQFDSAALARYRAILDGQVALPGLAVPADIRPDDQSARPKRAGRIPTRCLAPGRAGPATGRSAAGPSAAPQPPRPHSVPGDVWKPGAAITPTFRQFLPLNEAHPARIGQCANGWARPER